MAFLLGCENVHLEYPTKTIFSSLSLGIDDGAAIGVVGKNGDGKSSLLRLFDGTIEPDEGRVLRTRGVRVATLAQKDVLDDNATVLASILGDTPEYVWASDARVREILDNLVGDLDPNARIGALSVVSAGVSILPACSLLMWISSYLMSLPTTSTSKAFTGLPSICASAFRRSKGRLWWSRMIAGF